MLHSQKKVCHWDGSFSIATNMYTSGINMHLKGTKMHTSGVNKVLRYHPSDSFLIFFLRVFKVCCFINYDIMSKMRK